MPPSTTTKMSASGSNLFISEGGNGHHLQKLGSLVLAQALAPSRMDSPLNLLMQQDTPGLSTATPLSIGGPPPSSSSPSVVPTTNEYGTLEGYITNPSDLDLIVNVTREYPFRSAKVLFGYIMPVILVITVITNTMIVMVLAQRHMRTPTNIVLFTMAIVDLMTLLSPSPWYFYIYTLGYHDEFLFPPLACRAHHYMTDVIPVFFHTSSIWLALLLASQRYVYVCHPTLAPTWCTVPKVRKAIFFILAFAFMHQGTRFFDSKFTDTMIIVNRKIVKACKHEIATWVEKFDVAIYYTTYYTFRILFVFVIPCTALITLNFLLFRALKRAEAKRSELFKTKFKLVGGNHRLIHQNHYLHHHRHSVEPNDNATIVRENSSFISAAAVTAPLTVSANFATKSVTNQLKTINNKSLRPQNVVSGHTMSTVSENEGLIAGTGDTRSISSKRIHNSLKQKSIGNQIERQDNPEGSLIEQNKRSDDNDEPDEEECIDDDEERRNSCSKVEYGSEIDDDIESVCPECASYERDDATSAEVCQRCSALLIETDKTSLGARTDPMGADYRRGSSIKLGELNHYQTISQCSSLVGAATNTTTNEDMSSCLATQNVSSSMLPQAHEDTTLDVIDGDEDVARMIGCVQGESSSLESADFNRQTTDRKQFDKQFQRGNLEKVKELNKTGSIDSRLACGCRMAKARNNLVKQFKHRRQMRNCATCRRMANNFNSQNTSQESHAIENNNNNNNNKKISVSMESARLSRSESSISGSHNQMHASKSNNEDNVSSELDCCDDHADFNHHRLRQAKAEQNRERTHHEHDANNHLDKHILTSQSNHCQIMPNSDSLRDNNEPVACSSLAPGLRCQTNLRKSQELEFACNMMATTTTTTTNTTTTTATTLYSVNTNSVGSLLQAATQLAPCIYAGDTASNKLPEAGSSIGSNFLNRIRSPPFRRVPTIGRGSRSTLLGAQPDSSNGNVRAKTMPLIVSGGSMVAATTPASIRTMDSNRTTLMLIVVLTVFLMVEVPVAIVTILHVVVNLFDVFEDIPIATSLDYIKLFTNFLIAISYSINFSIYCSMSKKFRETFRDLFLCGRRKRKRTQRLLNRSSDHPHYHHHQAPNTNAQFSLYNSPQSMPTNVNVSTQFDDHYTQSDNIKRGHQIKRHPNALSSLQASQQLTNAALECTANETPAPIGSAQQSNASAVCKENDDSKRLPSNASVSGTPIGQLK